MEETTLVSDSKQTNKQTNEVTDHYLSCRITLGHCGWKSKIDAIFDGMSFIAYPHKGSRTGKEHVHILVIDQTPEKIRNRISRAGYKGNEMCSVKGFHNGLLKGIQYVSKEGTQPHCTSDMECYISMAPVWEYRQESLHEHFLPEKQDRQKIRDWQLTYSNLVAQAVYYAKSNKMVDVTLKDVVAEMIERTKWRPAKQILSQGVPEFYSDDFLMRMGKRSKPNMDWWNERTFYCG